MDQLEPYHWRKRPKHWAEPIEEEKMDNEELIRLGLVQCVEENEKLQHQLNESLKEIAQVRKVSQERERRLAELYRFRVLDGEDYRKLLDENNRLIENRRDLEEKLNESQKRLGEAHKYRSLYEENLANHDARAEILNEVLESEIKNGEAYTQLKEQNEVMERTISNLTAMLAHAAVHLGK